MHPKEMSLAAKFVAGNKASLAFNKLSAGAANILTAGDQPSLYERLRNKLRKVDIDGEDLYIAEGDTLLDEAQLEVYAFQKQAVNDFRVFESPETAAHMEDANYKASEAGLGKIRLSDDTEERGLLGMIQNGKIVRWQPGFALTYCILRRTFPNAQQYEMVKANFKAATAAWEATCGIRFEYKEQLDNSTNTDPSDVGVVFVVRELNSNGQFIAAAFFPNDPAYRRRVFIDPSYYSSNGFDKIGVLRHELGHVLGFRHEHPRPGGPSSCPHEDLEDTTELTEYDSRSVMHYMCGGVGDPELKITVLDKVGAQKVYGPPLEMMSFVS